MRSAHARAAAVVVSGFVLVGSRAQAGSSFATSVVEYEQGANPVAGYTDESAALGEPTRFTGIDVFPSVVSPFSPPYLTTEIVSIGAGGWLTLAFDEPIIDEPGNDYGVDFLIFTNVAFIDADYPSGVVGGGFGNDPFVVEVSPDGTTWETVPQLTLEELFPTCGYIDSGPYDAIPGAVLTDFTKPVNPAMNPFDVFGMTYDELMELYDGSGGGAGFDLGATSFDEVSYVRISNPGNPKFTASVEIDAVARVLSNPNAADFVSSDTFQPPGDGVVDSADLAFLLGEWGENPGSPADIVTSNTFQPPGDGVVNAADLAFVLIEWTP